MATAYQLPLHKPASINRSECREWVGCRLTACRHNLGLRPSDHRDPCVLNWAEKGGSSDDGGLSHQEIADLMAEEGKFVDGGMSAEWVRLEELKLAAKLGDLREFSEP
jgi:hypothetical protein